MASPYSNWTVVLSARCSLGMAGIVIEQNGSVAAGRIARAAA
ncbi:MAG TPA: hypothetical protein VLM40_09560 [Gemmata sp.]|nr:hypothetical protein [Gemmata sp.]